MSESSIVVVKDLEKKYKSGTHAVKGINFEVKISTYQCCIRILDQMSLNFLACSEQVIS